MKKTVFALLVFLTLTFGKTDLLDASAWTVGSSSTNGLTDYSSEKENEQVLGIDFQDNSRVLWMSKPDASHRADRELISS
ncbi:hypothetical protein [Ulvibacterium sp.]|uniref:hypothetical protein n=1 Tax=Ulvibacterium sp. TaxID=2665914 RepID=UPI003BAA6ABC